MMNSDFRFTKWIIFIVLGVILIISSLIISNHFLVSKDYLYRSSPLEIRSVVNKIADIVDFDNDNYSIISILKDPEEYNPSVNPFAIDIPNNGIDEDRVGGDLTSKSIHAIENDLKKQKRPNIKVPSSIQDLININGNILFPS